MKIVVRPISEGSRLAHNDRFGLHSRVCRPRGLASSLGAGRHVGTHLERGPCHDVAPFWLSPTNVQGRKTCDFDHLVDRDERNLAPDNDDDAGAFTDDDDDDGARHPRNRVPGNQVPRISRRQRLEYPDYRTSGRSEQCEVARVDAGVHDASSPRLRAVG